MSHNLLFENYYDRYGAVPVKKTPVTEIIRKKGDYVGHIRRPPITDDFDLPNEFRNQFDCLFLAPSALVVGSFLNVSLKIT